MHPSYFLPGKRILAVSIILLFVLPMATMIFSDDDDDDDENHGEYGSRNSRYSKGKTVPITESNAVYTKECGECHFAYQPGLLLARSWERLLLNESLADHFGEVLEYDPSTKNSIRTFLTVNASDRSDNRLSRKISRSIPSSSVPIKISETRYIQREHNSIPARMISGNHDVKTLGNCTACHSDAGSGNYDEDQVRIPNYPNYRH